MHNIGIVSLPSPSRMWAWCLVLQLTACTTLDTARPPAGLEPSPPPAAWRNVQASDAPQDSSSLTDWWSRFDDPVLSQLIERALRDNPGMGTMLSRIQQARAERGLARAELYPDLSAGLSGSLTESDGRNNNADNSTERYGAELTLAWQVDLFGRQRQYLDAAIAEVAATTEDYYAAQLTLITDVAVAYFNLRSYEQRYTYVKESVRTREDTLLIAQWQAAAGEDDALATQQSLVSVKQALAQLPPLAQSIEESRNQLALLCGDRPGELDTLLKGSPTPVTVPGAPAVGIPADTLQQRPDVRAASASITAASARLSAAERARLPSLNLTGSIGVETFDAKKLLDPEAVVSGLIVGLTGPVWDAGRISSEIEFQSESLRQAYLEYQDTVLTALSEVENSLSSVANSSQTNTVLEAATESARISSRLAQLKYEAGEVDMLTVLDTERTRLTLEQSLATARASLLIAHVQLYTALGGGWVPLETDG